MPFRVTDASTQQRLAAQIATSRQRLTAAQERVASGKRINRPSDDPTGAAAVIRLRTSQTTIEQFRRSAGAATDTLIAGDSTLEVYQQALDRAAQLLVQGASDTTSDEGRRSVAAELESIREHVLTLANTRRDDQYLFGGTRQNVPPYDAAGTPAAGQTSPSLIQVEPDGAPVAVGVTAETVFADASGTIFDALEAAGKALRGTADPAADRATVLAQLDRLSAFAEEASVARAQIGASLERVETITERLDQTFLAQASTLQRIESADFVESAIQLTESERALSAVLQTAARLARRSLIDLLG